MSATTSFQQSSFKAVSARTTELPGADKFAYWNDVICSTVVDLDCRPIALDNFEASIEGFDTPEIGVYHIHTQPHLVYRGAPEIARLDSDALVINFVTSGTLYSEQDSRGVLLKAGDAAISDAARPYFLRFDDPLGCVSVKISKSALSGRIHDYRKITASSLVAGSALAGLTFDYMSGLLKLASGLDERTALKASGIFRDLLGATVEQLASSTGGPGGADASRHRSVALLQVKNFVEGHLHEPDLDASMVARATRMSVRYINKLFADESTSLGRHIWNRRLDRCAAALRDPRHGGDDIATIAYRLGFADAAHFSRAFKARFGRSPREFRQAPRL